MRMPRGTSGSDPSEPPPPAARRDRRARLAAPWIVGGLTAVITAVTTSLESLTLPEPVRLGVVGGVAALAGLAAWGTQQGGGDGRSGGTDPAGDPAPAAVPAQLPPVIAHFTGRDRSLAELRRAFAPESGSPVAPLVVSVHGPAGVGKSALAARFAHEIAEGFPDGQLYFDLRGDLAGGPPGGPGDPAEREARVRPEEVLIGFLLALGVRLTTDPGGLQELRKLWWTWARGRSLLVLLDNAHDADQVQALLPPVGGCAVLVTSRQPLYLRNTFDLRLQEFTAAHGVELLRRLAGDRRVAEDPVSAAAIVELCGRLPLAIGICGGRLAARRNWTLREMAGRLQDERRRRLDELEIARNIDGSVRASLQLSYDDCTGTQRRLLRALGLLTAPDVQAWVAGALLDVSDLEGGDHLEALVDAQLVECTGTDATGEMRYRLHDLVRLYARERAEREDSGDDRHAAIERVLDGYRERAEAVAAARWPQDWHRRSGTGRTAAGRVGTGRSGPARAEAGGAAGPGAASGPAAIDWLTSERPALLALLDQAADREMWGVLWRLGRASCSLFHSLRVFWQEWRTAAELTCAAARHLDDGRSLGIALLERATVSVAQGQPERALADQTEALEIFTGLREGWWRARALRAVGMSLRDAGNIDESQRYLLEAIEAFEHEGDRWWHARAQRNLAELRLAQRRPQEARELLEDALEVLRRNGHRYSEAQTLRALGEVLAAEARALHAAGDLHAAEVKFSLAAPTLERAAEVFRFRHEQWEEARCLRAAGEVGDPRNGLRELIFVRQAKEMLENLGDSWGVARTRVSEGRAFGRLERHDEAAASVRRAIAAFDDLGDRWWQARSRRALAEVLIEAGRGGEARGPAAEALEIYRSLGNAAGESLARDVLARASGPAA
ncbi:tetratricopeptide repeat protein [Actinomadura viridis]|uniref:tetratricopeptide repeat protein n=1 Tax=Actinomadura viridis TaxID=58110 RepID=UPI0036CED18D